MIDSSIAAGMPAVINGGEYAGKTGVITDVDRVFERITVRLDEKNETGGDTYLLIDLSDDRLH